MDIFGLFRSTLQLTDVPLSGSAVPGEFRLEQNYPNPFNPSTLVKYQLPVASFVELKVYDILGREITVLVNEWKGPGRYEARWDASGLPSGVYICQLVAGNFQSVRKMALMK